MPISNSLAPILEREEYVEQAYLFRVFQQRLDEGISSQDVLARIHEEILPTTRLPIAVQFLNTELKHGGQLHPALIRLPHYFTPFQAFVVRQAEEDKQRFSFRAALGLLAGEAKYRADTPTPQGLFFYQFESLCRCRLGYNQGLWAMAQDSFYSEEWRTYIEGLARGIGDIEFADLVYVRSQTYADDQRKAHASEPHLPILFGTMEGRIAKASHGRDPLFLFSALQRQLNYPEVPRQKITEDQNARWGNMENKLREMEARIRLLESEVQGQGDAIQTLSRPDIIKDMEERLSKD
jgi:hypothetical protein